MAVQAREPAEGVEGPSGVEPPSPDGLAFDAQAMARLPDGSHRELRARVRSLLASSEFEAPPEIARSGFAKKLRGDEGDGALPSTGPLDQEHARPVVHQSSDGLQLVAAERSFRP